MTICYEPAQEISIHALREEGDDYLDGLGVTRAEHFYPRPPRGGRRHDRRPYGGGHPFLSTPSARRATVASCLPPFSR